MSINAKATALPINGSLKIREPENYTPRTCMPNCSAATHCEYLSQYSTELGQFIEMIEIMCLWVFPLHPHAII